jgi:hypothetical protein
VHIIGHSFVRDVVTRMKGLRPFIVLDSNTILSTQYRAGAHIRDVQQWLMGDERTFDVVVVDIGTNDVDSTSPTPLCINSFVEVVSRYRELRPETIVVIMPIVERAVVRYRGSVTEFNDQATTFNTQVRRKLEEDRGVFVWRHEERFDLRADGVHLAKSRRGLLAYGNSLVAAVSGACRRWREVSVMQCVNIIIHGVQSFIISTLLHSHFAVLLPAGGNVHDSTRASDRDDKAIRSEEEACRSTDNHKEG